MNIFPSKNPICVGPMSSEVIESVFKFSDLNNREMMLISSKNQIDYKSGYVNSWNTKQYKLFLDKMKNKYSKSNVKICRDHCGPGFNGNYSLKDTYNTISSDIENNFNLIHIDFSKLEDDYKKILNHSKKAIKFAQSLNASIGIEVGTDENLGQKFSNMHISDFEDELKFFLEFIEPKFFVVPTGSLVLEDYQVGKFNKFFVNNLKNKISNFNIKLKEHNADYFNKEDLSHRKNIIDALNIAPQFGVNQTQILINNCQIYGINSNNFLEKSYSSKKWEKWLHTNNKENKLLCAILAGHYNFDTYEYKKLIEQLNNFTDIENKFIHSHYEIIDFYSQNF